VVNPAITLGALSLRQWTLNQSGYDGQISFSGGTGTYGNLSVTGLPHGLSYVLSGNTLDLIGTPIQTGTFTLAVSLQDSTGSLGSRSYKLTINPLLALLPRTLPYGTPGYSYGQALAASGGTGPDSFAVIQGKLPPGLTLNSAAAPAQRQTHGHRHVHLYRHRHRRDRRNCKPHLHSPHRPLLLGLGRLLLKWIHCLSRVLRWRLTPPIH